MKKIRVAWPAILVALFAPWWLGDPAAHRAPENFIGRRNLAMQASCAMAIGAMSAAIVLAPRPLALERATGPAPWRHGQVW